MTELARGPYRSAGELAKREGLPSYLRAQRASAGLALFGLRMGYGLGGFVPTAALVFVAVKLAVALGPVSYGAPLVTLALLLGTALYMVTHRPYAHGTYRAARQEVKRVFRAQGALPARRIAEEILAWVARRPWRWGSDEWDRALYGYTTICFAAGDFARVLALRDAVSEERRHGLAFACAAVLLGDEKVYRASLPALPDPFHWQREQWAVARSMARLAGLERASESSVSPWDVSDAQLDELHAKRIAYVASQRQRERSHPSWPTMLDPWELFELEEALRWLDRVERRDEFDELRAHLQSERARLHGGTETP